MLEIRKTAVILSSQVIQIEVTKYYFLRCDVLNGFQRDWRLWLTTSSRIIHI